MSTREDIADSMLDEIVNAEVFGRGNRFRDGRYELEIKKFFLNKGYKGKCIICEFEVEKATATVKDVAPNEVGSKVSAVFKIFEGGDAGKMAKTNLKSLLINVAGVDAADVDADELKEALKDALDEKKQALVGRKVGNETNRSTIQKGPRAGEEGVWNNFFPITE